MINIKTLLVAAAISTGVAFAMPAAAQAMPASAPVKMQTVKDGNLVEVRHKKRWRNWRESRRWRGHRRWAGSRYCNAWDGCYRRHRHYRYRYYEPYYGYYAPYPYYGYYGRPRFYGPGFGFSFRF